MKKYVEIQVVAMMPPMGSQPGLYENNGCLYIVQSVGMAPVYVGSSMYLPPAQPDFAPVLTQSAGGEITPDHLIKLAAVLLQPGTVADLYGKVQQ